MNVLPVIVRELRVEARRPANHWLRVGGALVLLVLLWNVHRENRGQMADDGARIFGQLNTAIFAAIWILVPLLTADCISREKRDGTLGLLFLTPLTARGIAFGKSAIHLLRALTLLLAVIPVLVIPVLLGGVGWFECWQAFLLNLASIFLALAAGLLASGLATAWVRALLLAEIFAAGFFFLLGLVNTYAVFLQVALDYMPGVNLEDMEFFLAVKEFFALLSGADAVWSEVLRMMLPGGVQAWLWVSAEMLSLAMLIFGLAVSLAGRHIARTWRSEPPSKRVQGWQQTFTAPRFWHARLRQKMSRRLEMNPIGWLHEHTWSARLTKWGWCLAVVMAECVLTTKEDWNGIGRAQFVTASVLSLAIAFSAAGSFMRERQTGAMELILVTPLSVEEIIRGRLRALWRQFLPALAVIWVASLAGIVVDGVTVAFTVLFLSGGTCLTLSVAGLYFSLRLKNFLTAWLLTWAFGLLLPVMAGINLGDISLDKLLTGWGLGGEVAEVVYFTMQMLLCQFLVSFFFAWRLHRNLSRRVFILGN